jgi:hypothetical protein
MQVPSYIIENGPGASVRADMTATLVAMATQNAGATAPPTTLPYMLWLDETAGRFKIRNAANTAWITLPLSVTASNTIPDAVTALENLAARKLLRLGAAGAEWQADPAAAGSGATLTIGPETAGAVQAHLGVTIHRATGAVEVGTGATAGAADHLKVHGGVAALLQGFTCPDGSLVDTAGVRKVYQAPYNLSASYSGTSWGVIGTNLRLVITPQRTSSRFLVLATMCGACQSHGFWRVHRDGSPLGLSSGAYERAHGNLLAANSRVPITQSVVLYDSGTPGATVTYQIALRADSGTYPVYLNQAYGYGSATYDMFGTCSLVALEIGGV